MEQMSDQELKQLFDKLDVNRDGKVGLQEFLNGLFQHGSSTAPSPKQPISNHQQKPQTVRTDASSTDVLDIDASLFSTLDPEGIGFAKPALIIELWESLGISHGGDILEYLQFSLSSIVNLSALSKALHHEIHHVEGDNAVYQAAIVSYENELRCLR
ncbi:hypothetical protein CAPTEDRAFT_192092 [Capitella teleta]|uniref:EF-hand domain-containing protein n=1 Tax=Capitella teleta TaxID=283909 RepID=R7UP38_CAPTE|nr:hypothetical protein CAPTEDRAFT_192092 [Capitella teleta]|eukprot:ELU07878.1 hypothetical protein CAPTEDRAFT_192092 [Capitella teleta]